MTGSNVKHDMLINLRSMEIIQQIIHHNDHIIYIIILYYTSVNIIPSHMLKN